MGDTEVAGQSPADDEQQPPEAAASQPADSQGQPSAPGQAEPVTDPPAAEPDNKYEG